jgi:hypothetical protein
MSATLPAARNKELVLIHVGAKALGIVAESDYIGLLHELTGMHSSGDMSAEQRQVVLRHLRAKGAFAKVLKSNQLRSGGKSHARQYTPKQRKALACWGELARRGEIEHADVQALDAWVKGQTKVDTLVFLNAAQLDSVVNSLVRWIARVNKPAVKCLAVRSK